MTWISRSSRGANIRAETVLAPACPFRAGRRGQPDPGQGAGGYRRETGSGIAALIPAVFGGLAALISFRYAYGLAPGATAAVGAG